MNIEYTDNLDEITPEQLAGFFNNWPHHPDAECHLEILKGSHKIWLAMEESKCVGFINAVSDGILSACIPLLEVLPEYQGKGIGSELVRRMIASLGTIYSIDIVCDENVTSFYRAQGFSRLAGMVKRNYENQKGHS